MSDDAFGFDRAAFERRRDAILGASTRDVFDGLTVWSVSWSREASTTPAAHAALAAGDAEAFRAAVGPASEVRLSSDGRQVDHTEWCQCGKSGDGGSWVRYERWSARGMEAHGFACPLCRRLTQTG